MTRPRLYLAGPAVFMPDRLAIGESLKASCEAAGCEGLYPLDADMGAKLTADSIFRACLDMLARADAVVADLSPFRGPHVDDGTAFELGFAVSRGLPAFGYSSDLRALTERIPARPGGDLVDRDGIAIENLGEAFNAMIAGALTEPAFADAAAAIAAAAAFLRRQP